MVMGQSLLWLHWYFIRLPDGRLEGEEKVRDMLVLAWKKANILVVRKLGGLWGLIVISGQQLARKGWPWPRQLQGNEFCQEPVSMEKTWAPDENCSPGRHLDFCLVRSWAGVQITGTQTSEPGKLWDNKRVLF